MSTNDERLEVRANISGREFALETGVVARQANGGSISIFLGEKHRIGHSHGPLKSPPGKEVDFFPFSGWIIKKWLTPRGKFREGFSKGKESRVKKKF